MKPVQNAQNALMGRLKISLNTNRAKNIILFVADGMGVSTVTAGRIYEGQQRREDGEENVLSFETFPFSAFIKTYSLDHQVSDSAATATALNSGMKTLTGAINTPGIVPIGNCEAMNNAWMPVTIGDLARQSGRSVGLVSTARITHATPAAVYAFSPSRAWESDSNVPEEEKALGCIDIAQQLVNYKPDIALGGGLESFLPAKTLDTHTGMSGNRLHYNLINQWLSYENASFVDSASDLQALNIASHQGPVLGLFNSSHMTYELDRDKTHEPSLTDMAVAAVDKLSQDEDGFYLMIEAGRVDHAHHAGTAKYALSEMTEFHRAIQAVLDRVNLDETLVIVTADHSHVMTISGYSAKGHDILGLVQAPDGNGGARPPATARDGKPYTTLGYYNGPGGTTERPREDLSNVDTTANDFHQQAAIPLSGETHAGEDVPLYAIGPWAHLLSGSLEQNVVYHVMRYAFEADGNPETLQE